MAGGGGIVPSVVTMTVQFLPSSRSRREEVRRLSSGIFSHNTISERGALRLAIWQITANFGGQSQFPVSERLTRTFRWHQQYSRILKYPDAYV